MKESQIGSVSEEEERNDSSEQPAMHTQNQPHFLQPLGYVLSTA